MAMDVVDYEIKGSEMQFVEIELDPGEAAIGEAGSLFFMDAGIGMDTVFGDGSKAAGRLVRQAARRRQAAADRRVAVHHRLHQPGARPSSGSRSPRRTPARSCRWTCSQLGGMLICQKDAFLCAARGVSLGIAFQQKLGVGFFGGEGFIMQKLEGDGLAFVHAGGTIVQARAGSRARR